MSLYEYAIAVSTEDAERYVSAIKAPKRHSIFSYCCDNGPCKLHAVTSELGRKYSIYKEGLCLGRPWTGEGMTSVVDILEEEGLRYVNPITLDERVGGRLLGNTLTDEERAWIIKNAGKLIIKVNDNEW